MLTHEKNVFENGKLIDHQGFGVVIPFGLHQKEKGQIHKKKLVKKIQMTLSELEL